MILAFTLAITLFPRDVRLIVIIGLVSLFIVLGMYYVFSCVKLLPPAIIPLNPSPEEHGHKGYFEQAVVVPPGGD